MLEVVARPICLQLNDTYIHLYGKNQEPSSLIYILKTLIHAFRDRNIICRSSFRAICQNIAVQLQGFVPNARSSDFYRKVMSISRLPLAG